LARTLDEGLREATPETLETPDVLAYDDTRLETPVESPYADDRMTAADLPTAGSDTLDGADLMVADRAIVAGPAGATQLGTVTKVHANGYGFVRGDDGADYYFRRADFVDALEFTRLERFRTRLSFRVSEAARPGQAGRAASITIGGITDGSGFVGYRSPAPVGYATGQFGGHTGTTGSADRHVAATPFAASSDDLWAADPFAAPRRRVDAAPVVPAPALVAPATVTPEHSSGIAVLDTDDGDVDPFAPRPRATRSQPEQVPVERDVSVAAAPPMPEEVAVEVAVEAPVAAAVEEPEAASPVKKKRATRKSVSA
jgi:hypothetical protein